MQWIEIDGREYRLGSLKLELEDLDLIAWLSHQSLYPKVFWKEKDGLTTRAALGNLIAFPHLPRLSEGFDFRLYGGMRFAKRHTHDDTWRGFPQECFWLPQIEVTQEREKTHAIFYYLNDDSPLPVHFQEGDLPPVSFSILDRQDTPDFHSWNTQVEQILQKIESGAIGKLVLARKTSLQFSHSLSPWPLMKHLRDNSQKATLFTFQLAPDLCFFGATPEKLFSREGNALNTDAVASTRPRGETQEEDRRLEEELLSHPKEKREFAFVKEFLETNLKPLSEEISWDGADRILKGSHVQHIHNRLNAKLKAHVTDSDLIRTLHPTPALGGYPQQASLSLLKETESFDRGWYGAPVGVISPRRSSFYVAIRSALMRERALHLFSGTGLVQGSTPKREWEELEQKIRSYTEMTCGNSCAK